MPCPETDSCVIPGTVQVVRATGILETRGQLEASAILRYDGLQV